MADISFDEEKITASRIPQSQKPRGLTGWLVAHKFAKDQAMANLILLLVTLLAVLASVLIYLETKAEPRVQTPAEKAEYERMIRHNNR